MNSNNTTNTKRKYRVLDPEERGEIMIGLSNEESIRSIATRLYATSLTLRRFSHWS